MESIIKDTKNSESLENFTPSWWEDPFGGVSMVAGPWQMGETWIEGDRKVF